MLALAQVTFIKSRTARIFWDNGYKSVGAVAAADAKELIPILLMVFRLRLLVMSFPANSGIGTTEKVEAGRRRRREISSEDVG